jgi:molecular chaperone HtpG
MSADGQEFQFQAETQRVLSLVINSLYTNSEVFLRELISNASDALDKARYLLTAEHDAMGEQAGEPAIDITLDEQNGILTIEDNGVGMTRDEAIEHLGTIARSGTDQFVSKLAAVKDKDNALELIGQFGVGFYAVFMVGKRVDVETMSLRKGSEAVLWRSSGEGTFNVLAGERDKPGTKITIHLKPDATEFAKKWRVEGIIKKYSDFVMYPIRVDGKQANRGAAPWRQPRTKVSEEEHVEFFKHITQGRHGDKPLATIHYSVDAPVQFSALVYVPERAPFDLFMAQREKVGLRLYARRVLIMESCEHLLPVYLRFVRGVVDSEDLTLNVSRETLQENRTLKQIESQLTKQILKELGRIADEDPERYGKFWKLFGQVIKEGLTLDFKNKDALTELLRFGSLKSKPGTLVSLKQYTDNLQPDQKAIYYITGATQQQVDKSPHLEVFRKNNLDVLLLLDPIDEWVVKSITTYADKPLKSVTHGELDLPEDAPKDDDEKQRMDATVAAIAKVLGDRVDEVRVTHRLTETASCLVSREGDPGANMERIMKILDERAEERKRILEVNPDHPFVKNLATLVERDRNASHIELWSEMLYDQALLSEGVIEDSARLVKRIQDLLVESSAAKVAK